MLPMFIMKLVRCATVVAVASCLAATDSADAQFRRPGGKRKAVVSLMASVDAVVAGRAFDVAVAFKLAPRWHIYWKNPGDSGLPPSVTWTLPDGFTTSPLAFPVPKRHVAYGFTTNIMDGEPVLLARVTPPDVINTDRVVLAADLVYLVCDTTCIRETAKLTLELPVRSAESGAKPAHDDVFARARRALPKQPGQHLTITPSVTAPALTPGARFDVVLGVRVKTGLHIQSHDPLSPNLIATTLLFERTPGIELGDPVFPKPKVRTLPVVGRVSEFDGAIDIRVPVTVDEGAPDPPIRIGGLMTYQACNSNGQCFPAQTVSFATTIGAARDRVGTGAAPDAGPGRGGAGGEPVGARVPGAVSASVENAGATGAPAGAPFDAGSGAGVQTSDAVAQLPSWLQRFGMVGLLIGCFIYGLVLNATPCVLPLLSIKVLGFVQHAHESRRRTLALGLSFGAGVMVFFVALGFLAASGQNVLQFPAAVIGLGAVVMALALSMLGVYTLQVPTAATKLDASIQKEGMFASFGKGALAPVLGFACTGPALAFALMWATQQPPRTAVLAFLLAGLGMASPYMLLGANPNWLSFLPKPGQWMITFERIMGFLLLAMVVVLIHPLVTQVGAEGLEWTIAFFVVIGMACWLWGRIDFTMATARRWRYRASAVAVVVVAGILIYGWRFPLRDAAARERARRLAHTTAAADDWSFGIPWRPWSPDAVEAAVRAGKTVFVDVTAASCTNCKINKARATNTDAVRRKMKALGVVPFQADYTTPDDQIEAFLARYGQLGPPLNLIYPAGKPTEPIKLRTLFTRDYLLEKLDAAGPSRDVVASAASS
ncbi:MAG: protein-disulfide reductase DsbD domain-containing protein [Phycisphaerae bacterium]